MALSGAAAWSTQQLAEFAAALTGLEDAEQARRIAVERAAEALDAEYGALVREHGVLASIGWPAGAEIPAAELVTDRERVGEHYAAAVIVDGDEPATLVVLRAGDEPYASGELTLLRGMARVLGLALQSIESLRGLRERQALLERLSRIQRSISNRVEIGRVLHAITEGARDLVGVNDAALRLVDDHDPTAMEIVSAVGFTADVLSKLRRGRVGTGAGGRAIAEERLVVIEEYTVENGGLAELDGGGVWSAMAAPVRIAGVVAGSIVVSSPDVGRRWSASERDVLLAFADHASLALTDAQTVADAMHQAVHDPLTGLPNRALFNDRLEHALDGARRRGMGVGVLFLDLDHFKHVNDTHGHEAGDQLLMSVAARLRAGLRANDTVARFGGDEFAVLLEDVDSEASALKCAEQVTASFGQAVTVGESEHFVTASIGVAFAPPLATDDDAHTLLRDADAAMYRVKARGRAGFELFDEELRDRVAHRLQVERELGDALRRGELRLALQPQIELPSGRLVGAEALVRWAHPTRGELAAGEFVPVAEESGLIVPVGRWVIEAACREAAELLQLRPQDPLRIAVNVSGRELAHPGLAEAVGGALQRHGLTPAALELEITESVLLDDADQPRAVLQALRELGCRLMLDDFGTGFASLGYLRRLPLDGLKVDRSFVDGLGIDDEATAIVEATAGIARGMALELVAEGVGTAEQLDTLCQLGAQRAQGYLLGRPMTPSAFRALAVREAQIRAHNTGVSVPR